MDIREVDTGDHEAYVTMAVEPSAAYSIFKAITGKSASFLRTTLGFSTYHLQYGTDDNLYSEYDSDSFEMDFWLVPTSSGDHYRVALIAPGEGLEASLTIARYIDHPIVSEYPIGPDYSRSYYQDYAEIDDESGEVMAQPEDDYLERLVAWRAKFQKLKPKLVKWTDFIDPVNALRKAAEANANV